MNARTDRQELPGADTGRPNAVLIDERDNVLISVRPVAEGEVIVTAAGESLMAREPIGTGHKIARCDLHVGDKVLRYGAPIGSITRAVVKGSHVHTHNARSDYIPTHERGGAKRDD